MNKSFKFSHIAFIFVLCCVRISIAQTAFQTDKDLIKQGDKLFKEEKFVEAYPIYSQLVIRTPQDPQYNYRLGVCTIFSVANKELAVPFLENAMTSSEVEQEVHYYLGKAYLLSYRFEEAAKQFKRYREVASPKNIEKYQIDQQIEMCANGVKLVRNIADWVVVEKKELNSKDFFLAYDLSTIGGKLLIKPNEEKFKTALDLKKKEESIIFLSRDNRQIFFSSYGKDGSHGKDIYHITKLPNGNWSNAQILPNTINTDADEDFPFFHPNGKVLYFCSKGLTSMGGYDIFKCSYNSENNNWGKPENLGFPINSPDDDILYVTDTLEKEAYFSSSRSTPPNKISVYKLNIEKKPSEWLVIKGIILPNRSGQSLLATITVKNYLDNSIIGVFNSNDNSGKYLLLLPNGVNCVFTVECEGFATQSQLITIPLRFENYPIKQEMSYDLKSDKLVLRTISDNFNEEEYDQLVPAVIKNKALLNVTSTPKPVVGSLNNNDILGMAFEDAKELTEEAIESKKQADVALELANQKNDLALQKSKEAQTMYQVASKYTGGIEQKNILMDSANNAIKEAEELKLEAAATYKLAKKMESSSITKKKEADLSLLYAQALDNASKAKNSPESMAKVIEIEKQLDDLNKNNTDTVSIFNSYKIGMESKQKELDKVLKNVTNIKQEITDNEALITKSQSEADKTRNKSLKEGLLNEIEGLKQDNDDRHNELKKYETKAKKLQDEYNSLAKESAIANDVVSIAKKGETPPAAIIQNKKAPVAKASKPILPAPVPTPIVEKTAVEEYNYDQLLAELNEFNAENVDAAMEIKEEIERENAKAKAYNTWASDLIALAEGQKLNLTKEKNTQNKNQISKLISQATIQAREKKALADQATAKANRLKTAQELAAKNAVAAKPLASAGFKVDYTKLLEEVNARNAEKIKLAEKEETETEQESAKAEAFYKWADDLNKYVAEIKTKTITEADKNKNTIIGANINKAKKLAQEKKLLGDQCSSRALKLKQLAIAQATEIKTVAPKPQPPIQAPPSIPVQPPVVKIKTETYKAELATAEKIQDIEVRERTKESIYKKIAKTADEEVAKLRIEYNKERAPNKSSDIAKEIKSQEALSRENNTLAKKSLVAANNYLKQKQADAAAKAIIVTKPQIKQVEVKPIEQKTIAAKAIETKTVEPKPVAVAAPPAPKENIPLYEIYNRYTQVKSGIKLAKNETFDVKPEAAYNENKPIPKTGVSKDGLIYTVQVGAFINPIPQGTFGGITPITAEPTNTGYMRYFAGQFHQFVSADNVKTQIRVIGFKDAFVVAYYNGKRISLTEALRIENGGNPPAVIELNASNKGSVQSIVNNLANTSTINEPTGNNNNKNKEIGNNTAAKIQDVDNISNIATNFNTTTTNNNNNSSNSKVTTLENIEHTEINNNTNIANNTSNPTNNNNTADITNNVDTIYSDNTTSNNNNKANTTNNQSLTSSSQNTIINKQKSTEPALAENVSSITGLFYTIQVGLFSQPVSADVFQSMNPLFNETTEAGKIRYTIGVYNNIARAIEAKEIIITAGINNSFITAFYNSKRITLIEARQLENNGGVLLSNSPVLNVLPYVDENKQTNAIAAEHTNTAQSIQQVTTPAATANNKYVETNSTKATQTQPTKTISTSIPTIPSTISSSIEGVTFKVQIGAYKEDVPAEKASIFAKLNAKSFSHYINENGLTIYVVGNVKTYEEASKLKMELTEQYGLTDVFIVAFKNDKKIPLSEVKIK